jgi:radical SAM protein with 4Fe4S-binding SPASM domain
VVWSHYLQKIPWLGDLYKSRYFAWKRAYYNLLRRTGLQPGPLVVHWLCTYRCNSHCVYCEASANEAKCEELTTAEIRTVIDDLHALKVRRFFVTGGEPLVRSDLFAVLAHARSRGLSVAMITNSLLWETFRTEIRDARFQSIWTSVDGLAETNDRYRGVPNAFATTLAAISYYRELGIPLRVVNTMAHPGNVDELPELLRALREAGINRWRLALAIPVGRAADNQWALPPERIEDLFRWVEQERKRFDIELSEELGYLGCYDLSTRNTPFICPSGLSFCVIMPEGSVLPCQVVYDTRYAEGNVRETPFPAIWTHGFRMFRAPQLTGVCATCRHRQACSGGCWGRILSEGTCLRGIWDPDHYGHERDAGVSAGGVLAPADVHEHAT